MPKKKRILDLFCKAGGASMGLHRAWPDAIITGVDIEPQPHYPFRFVQSDAMQVPLDGYDFIWASPPCQRFSVLRNLRRTALKQQWPDHPDLVGPIRERLKGAGAHYVIENVEGAPLQKGAIRLCGLQFGLKVIRHRYFESDLALLQPAHIRHVKGCVLRREIFCIVGSGGGRCWPGRPEKVFKIYWTLKQGSEAMGIDWMTRRELTQAVPPAYSEFILKQVPR
jgi:DNA (cytosine-5)-methyltransferase 1